MIGNKKENITCIGKKILKLKKPSYIKESYYCLFNFDLHTDCKVGLYKEPVKQDMQITASKSFVF